MERNSDAGISQGEELLPLNLNNTLTDDEDRRRSPMDESRYFKHSARRDDDYDCDGYNRSFAPRGRGRGRGASYDPWDYYPRPPPGWNSRNSGYGPSYDDRGYAGDPYWAGYDSWDSSGYSSGYVDRDDPRSPEDREGDCPEDETDPNDNTHDNTHEDVEQDAPLPGNDDADLVEAGAGPVPETEEDFLKAHKDNYAPESGPALGPSLTAHLKTVWERGRDGNLMKKFYTDHPQPEGTPFGKVDLNTDITTLLNSDPQKKHVVTRDARLKGIQTLVAKAAIPVAKVCNMLMQGDMNKQTMVDACLDSVAVLANACSQANQIRRDNLRPYINSKISNLVCKQRKENDVGQELFPKIQESAQAAKQGIGLLNMGRGLGRGRGGGGGSGRYRPYPPRGRGFRGNFRGYSGRYDSFLRCDVKVDGLAPANFDFVEQSPDLPHEVMDFINDDTNLSNTNLNLPVNDVVSVDCSREGSVPTTAELSTELSTSRSELWGSRKRGQERPTVNTHDEVSTPIIHFVSKWDVFQACRAKVCMARWRSITSDPWILKNLYGYKLEFLETPFQDRPIPEIRFNTKERAIMSNEIDKFLTKGILVPSVTEPGEFVSNVFLRPKKDPHTFRMIFNLTKLNDFVEYHHFKMETLDTALKLITPGAWMGSLDFTDAYYTLPVHPDHQKFLKFRFDGQLYQFVAVPMGLSSACRYFTKIMKVPLSVLRERSEITITGYIDDTLLTATSSRECARALEVAAELFQDLGFMISMSKSVFVPTTKIEYLGFVIDSVAMTVVPTTEKVNKLRKAVRKLMGKQATTIRHMAQVEGGLLATHPGNPWAPLFTKQMEIDKLQALGCNRFDFDKFMTVSEIVRSDLQWWLTHLGHTSGLIQEQYPDFLIYTDASLQGYGFFVPETGIQAGSRWSPEEALYHINILEMLAIEHALKATITNRHDIHVRIMCDNTTAIAGIRKQGSTRTPEINGMARSLWLWALERNIWLSAVHIPGVENVEADEASRVFKDELEWTLQDSWFRKICDQFGEPMMDLFASRLNFKVKMFCSFKPDPLASIVDAFTFPWNRGLYYGFPPFCLLGRTLQKIVQDGTSIILIVPNWPTKAWYPIFRRLLIRKPIHIRVTRDVLFLPHRVQESTHTHRRRLKEHPMSGNLELLAGMLLGRP